MGRMYIESGENRMLRNIVVYERDEVIESWRKLLNGKLLVLL
jgi:hypothetical protein